MLDRVRALEQQLDGSLQWERSRARTQLRREDEQKAKAGGDKGQKEKPGRDEVLQKMIQVELRKMLAPKTEQASGLEMDPGSVQGKRRRSAQSDDDSVNDRARVRVLRVKHDGFAVQPLPAEKKSEELARTKAVMLANQLARARKGGSTSQASKVLGKRAMMRRWKVRLSARLRRLDVKTVAGDRHDVEDAGANDDDGKDDGKDDGGWEVVTRRGKGRVAAQSCITPATKAKANNGGGVGKKSVDAAQKRRGSKASKGSASSDETEEMYL